MAASPAAPADPGLSAPGGARPGRRQYLYRLDDDHGQRIAHPVGQRQHRRSSGVNLAGAGATFDISASGSQTIKDLSGVAGSTVPLGANALTVGTANSTTFAGSSPTAASAAAALIKHGTGTLTLNGANTYTGGTTINAGLINFAALNNFGTGLVTLNGGGLQWAAGTTTDISSRLVLGAGGGTFDTGGNNVTFATGLTGTGGITKQGNGILNLDRHQHLHRPDRGHGRHPGGERQHHQQCHGGHGGTLGGNGTIAGLVTNDGTLAPGNSIGTLNVNGSFVQAPAASTRSRSMPRARATASTSPARRARPPSTAARCRCWPSPAATAPARPTRSSMPPAA